MTFLIHHVCPAACLLFLAHLTALHTFPHAEVAEAMMHISRVTKELVHLNNTRKFVLNIPKHNAAWQIITLLHSLFVRMYQVKIIPNRL